MEGIYIAEKTDKHIKFVSSDGRRMSVLRVNIDFISNADSIIEGKIYTMTILKGDLILLKIINEEYANYKRVLPDESEYRDIDSRIKHHTFNGFKSADTADSLKYIYSYVKVNPGFLFNLKGEYYIKVKKNESKNASIYFENVVKSFMYIVMPMM